MAPLATAYVRLRPTLSASEVRTQAVKAGEEAGVVMGRGMSSGLSRTFKAFAGLGAATGLVEAGRKVVEFADQFEGARARVETNTENIGASFAAVQKPLGALDSSMSALGFTITDTENSFAQLVTATRSPVKALHDVALAADIARGRHISLDEATQILMRVETGHVAMLGRLGIATHDASGHIFTQAQALDALAKAYGGNASKFAGTFAGKQAAARAEIQQSATEIGVALLPAFADLANVVAHDVLPPIADAAKFLDRNKRTIEPLAKAILITVAAWKAYTLATKAAVGITGLFGRVAGGTTVALTAEATAERAAAAGGVAAGAGAAATSAGGAIGAGMAAKLGRGAAIGSGLLGALKFGPVAGVGGISDVRDPLKDPQVLAQLQRAAAIARVNPAAAADFKKIGIFPLAEDTKRLSAWIAKWGEAKKSIEATAGAERNIAAVTARTAAQIVAAGQKTLGLRQAQDGLRQAMHDAAQTAADNGRALAGNTDAALANRSAVAAQVQQVFGIIDAMAAAGRSAGAQSNMLAILTEAVEINATKMYGDKSAVDALLRSLGLIPGEVANAAAAMASLNAAVAADKAISPAMVKAATHQQAVSKATGEKVAASFMSGYTPVVSKAAVAASKAATTAMQTATDKMKSDLQSIRDAIDSTRSSVAGFASFSATGTDSLGASGINTDVAGQLKVKASKLEQFARLFNQLDRDGLDAHLMAQFAQTGPDAIPAMQALLHSGRRGVRQVNRIERRILTAAGSVAATSAGEEFGKTIHDDLIKLPNKLERPFRRALSSLHVTLNAREIDYKNGVAVVISP